MMIKTTVVRVGKQYEILDGGSLLCTCTSNAAAWIVLSAMLALEHASETSAELTNRSSAMEEARRMLDAADAAGAER